jgi:hypothetical protein
MSWSDLGQREAQFAGPDDVQAQALAGQHADHGGRRERLGGEADPAALMPCRQPVPETAGPVPQGTLVDDERRGAELSGKLCE